MLVLIVFFLRKLDRMFSIVEFVAYVCATYWLLRANIISFEFDLNKLVCTMLLPVAALGSNFLEKKVLNFVKPFATK